MAMVHCRECGVSISESAGACPKCGAKQNQDSKSVSGGKSRTTAALLALFVGGAGIHRFYIGDNGKGVLYLLFCWTFIPAILALIDCVKWFGMSDDEFQRYVKSVQK